MRERGILVLLHPDTIWIDDPYSVDATTSKTINLRTASPFCSWRLTLEFVFIMPFDELGCWAEIGLLRNVELIAMHFAVFFAVVEFCSDAFANFKVIIW